MIYDDLAVFINDDFAHHCTHTPATGPSVQFKGVLSTVDDDRFGGQVMAGVNVLHYATAAATVRQGDTIVTQKLVPPNATPPAPVTWRVHRSPERVVDGAESVCYLSPT